jgi:serine/threonine protein kinase
LPQFLLTPSFACLAMEWYEQEMKVGLPPSEYAGAHGYCAQLASAVAWLHERSVVHCDIKVANVLVKRSDARSEAILVDFGFARLHTPESRFLSSELWGTPEYLSPERARGDEHDERLADVWALGVT